jgi:hypothetical protein
MGKKFAEESVSNEELGAEAAAEVEAPKPEKKSRKKKEVDPNAAPKEPKARRSSIADKYIKVLVPASESGLRAGTGRYQFLEAAADAMRCGDLIGQEFQVGDKTIKLKADNIQGMFNRGHIALSVNGDDWEKVERTVVAA